MLSIASDRLRRLVQTAVLAFLPATPFAQAEGRSAPDPYPLTAAQTLDAGNLEVTFRSDEVRPSRTHPGKKFRAVNLRYFSHAWKDGPWFGNTIVLLPEPMPADWGGQAAMCSPWPVRTEAGVNLIQEFMEHTALEFGIPVATCPDPGEHYGLSEIHQLSDHLMLQYFKTGDVTWLPGYHYAALRARALTAIGQLTKTPVRAAVHMGSSITAHHAWIWPKYDSRVRGLITSGDIGYFREMYPLGGECRGRREIMKALCRAEPALREVFLRHVDPYEFADAVRCPVLAVLGSNDFACPPLTVPKFLARLPGPTHLIQVPNHQHGNDSRQHIEGFRMWIDHLFYQRPLTSVAVEAMEHRSGRIRGTAKISGKTRLDRVQLFCLSTGEPKYFRSRRFLDAPDDSYSLLKAVWHAVPMKRDGQRWTVDAEVPGTKNRFAACFVAVTDFAGRTRGYASSPTLWLEDSSSSSAKPVSASTPIGAPPGFEFIDTGFENASPAWCEFGAGLGESLFAFLDTPPSGGSRRSER